MSDRVFYSVIVLGLMAITYGWGYIHGYANGQSD